MSEKVLDAIARRLQLIEQELAVLRREQKDTKRVLEERLDRVEEKLVALRPDPAYHAQRAATH